MNWQALHDAAKAYEIEKAAQNARKRAAVAALYANYEAQAPVLLEGLLLDALARGGSVIRVRLDDWLAASHEHVSAAELRRMKMLTLRNAVAGWGDAVPFDTETFQVGIGDKTRAYIKSMLEGGEA